MKNRFYVMKEIPRDGFLKFYEAESRYSENGINERVDELEALDQEEGRERELIKLRSVRFRVNKNGNRCASFNNARNLRILVSNNSLPTASVHDHDGENIGEASLGAELRYFDTMKDLTAAYEDLQQSQRYAVLDVVKEID